MFKSRCHDFKNCSHELYTTRKYKVQVVSMSVALMFFRTIYKWCMVWISMMECKIKMWRLQIWRVVHYWLYVLPAALHPNSVAFIEYILRCYLQVATLKAALDTDLIRFGWELNTMASCFHEHITWHTVYTSRHTAAHPRLFSLQYA